MSAITRTATRLAPTRPHRGGVGASLLLAASAAGGASLYAGSPDGSRTIDRLQHALWSRRHRAAFALRHLHQPTALLASRDSFAKANELEQRLWGGPRHVDDGIDAFRHAYASALLAARLVADGMQDAAAVRFVDDVGRANELDGVTGGRGADSRMDEHNNHVGALLGVRLAAHGAVPGERELLAAADAALAAGELRVLDAGQLRATRPGDLPKPLTG